MSQQAPPLQSRWVPAAIAVVLLLSMTSGVVDAISYLRFQVFVANQTGNLVIAALSFTDQIDESARIPSLIALAFFVVGVFLAVLLRDRCRDRGMADIVRRELLLAIEVGLIGVAAILVLASGDRDVSYASIAILSLGQGFQAVVITRIIGVVVQTVVINAAVVASVEELAARRYRAALITIGTPVGYLVGVFLGAAILSVSAPAALGFAALTAFAATLVVHRVVKHGGEVE